MAVPEVVRGAARDTIDLLGRQLLFITGKGGTGKSAVTAAIGELAAGIGKRTLMVEVDAKGNLTDFFEHSPVGFTPVEIHPNLFCMTMNTQDSLYEYLKIHLRMGRVAKVGPLARVFDFVSDAAPGVKEILTVGKITYEATLMRKNSFKWDLILVDAAPTGRIVGQLDAPAAINELFQRGMVQSQTNWMRDVLSDHARTALVIVTTPEEMPVTETIELYEATQALDVKLEGVVINKVLPELFNTNEEALFTKILSGQPHEYFTELVGNNFEPVADAAHLATQLRRSRVDYIDRLRRELPLPMLYLPYLFLRSQGTRWTTLFAEAIKVEMDL